MNDIEAMMLALKCTIAVRRWAVCVVRIACSRTDRPIVLRGLVALYVLQVRKSVAAARRPFFRFKYDSVTIYQ